MFVEAFFHSIFPEWVGIALLLASASHAVADLLITVLMMMLLSRARAQSDFRRTNDAISRINRVALQSGVLTTIIAICALSAFAGGRDIYAIFWELGTKSYAISLFANLNARTQFRARDIQHISTDKEDSHESYGFTAHALSRRPIKLQVEGSMQGLAEKQNERSGSEASV